MNTFIKFPSTPHVVALSDSHIRGNKIFSILDQIDFLQHEIIIEEKIDGANLGISFTKNGDIQLQNRGNIIIEPYIGQWKKLHSWLECRLDSLFDTLGSNLTLFGEWCYAQHSVKYTNLPDWFIGFDIYDKSISSFLGYKARNNLFAKMNIEPVPYITSGVFTVSELKKFLGKSAFSEEPSEGLYFRYDFNNRLVKRCKLVRPSFVQSIEEHWSRSALRPNIVNRYSAYDAIC